MDGEATVLDRERVGARDKLDPTGRKQFPDGVAGGLAEQAERVRLRGDDDQLRPARAALLKLGRGHQRKLIQRQRPAGSGRQRERHPPHPPPGEVSEEQPQVLDVTKAGERESAGDAFDMARAAGEDERVVGELLTGSRPDDPGIRVHRAEKARVEADPLARKQWSRGMP